LRKAPAGKDGAMLAQIPRDVRLAALAAVAVLFAAIYEYAPMLAMFLAFALFAVVVAVVVGRD
jgi:hypothetical protein